MWLRSKSLYALCTAISVHVGEAQSSARLDSGTVELAAMAGAAYASKAPAHAFATGAELVASVANTWGAYLSFARVPEFERRCRCGQQSFDIFSGGVQKQAGFRSLRQKLDLSTYFLTGFAFHGTQRLTRGESDYFPESFTQPAYTFGAGVRLFRHGTARWGVRLEYRGYLPLWPRFDFGIHHTFGGGLAVQLK